MIGMPCGGAHCGRPTSLRSPRHRASIRRTGRRSTYTNRNGVPRNQTTSGELNHNLLFRWFVGLSMDDPVWVPTVFSKNRDRLLEGDIAAAFVDAVLNLPRVKALLPDAHFPVAAC
jgi:hypothetical protein